MKVCSKCKVEKPESAFRRYSGRSRDGLGPLCQECQRQYEAQWRAVNRQRLAVARASRREKDKVYRRHYIEVDRARYLVSRIKRRAIKLGIPFDLDNHMSDLNARIAKGVCELTGLPLRMEHGAMAWDSPSLDRIRPESGYVYSNIRVVCFAVNAALGNWGEGVFERIATAYLRRS